MSLGTSPRTRRDCLSLASDAAAREDEDRLLWMIGGLYLAQGFPMGLMAEALPAMLRAGGAPLETVAFVPLASLPWMLKCLWAPLIDNHWSRRLGRRRSWLLPSQAALTLALLGLAALPVSANTAPVVVALLLAASLAAATQDIAADGLTAERLGRSRAATANTLQVGCVVLGMLLGGGGVLMLSETAGTHVAIAMAAAIPALTAVPVLLWREPPPGLQRPRARLLDFFQRRGAWAVAAVLAVFAAGRLVDGALAKLLLIDHGWSLTAVGGLSITGTALPLLLGAVLAKPLVNRAGIGWTLLAGVTLTLAGATLWLIIASSASAPTWAAVAGATLLDGVGGGLAAVAAFTLASRFAHGCGQAGTDMAVLQSLHGLVGMTAMATATALAAWAGFAHGFALAIGLGLLAVTATVRRLSASRTGFDAPSPRGQSLEPEPTNAD